MRLAKTHLYFATLALGCLQTLAGCSAGSATLSEQACSQLFDTLLEEHQLEIQQWGTQVQAARGKPDFEAVRAQGREIELRFLPRFEALGKKGCGLAKLTVLDTLHYLDDPYAGRLEAAFRMLEDLAHEHTNAPWICDLGDDNVIRYFLLSPKRDEAIELLQELARSTTDEEAPRAFSASWASSACSTPLAPLRDRRP